MKKFLLWTTSILLTPIVLFLVATLLLYIPSVQNYIVQKAVGYLSEATGADVSVERVTLSFPLDLRVEKVCFIKPDEKSANVRDTIADVRSIVSDVQLWPLFKGKVVIDQFRVNDAKFDTDGFISAARVKGFVSQIEMKSRGVDLLDETVNVDGFSLDGGDVDIAMLPDTLPPDDTASEAKWKISIAKASIGNTKVAFHTIGDTMKVAAAIKKFEVQKTFVDLGTLRYEAGRIAFHGSKLSVDNKYEPYVNGLDANHIELSDIGIVVDSLFYQDPKAGLIVRQFRMKEKSGLAITDMFMPVALDSSKIDIPVVNLSTADSKLSATCSIDLNAFDQHDPGKVRLHLFAELGKGDLLRYAGALPIDFVHRYPERALRLVASANGNLRRVDIDTLYASLPDAFDLEAKGYALNPTRMEKMKAKVKVNASTGNLSFLNSILSSEGSYRIPKGMKLNGQLSADGQDYRAALTLREGRGKVKFDGRIIMPTESYSANIDVANLDIRHFMPLDSLKLFSGDVNVSGRGFSMLSKSTRLKAEANVRQFGYGHLNVDNVTLSALLENGVAHARLNSSNALLDGEINFDALVSTRKLQATLSTDIRWADMQLLRVSEKPLTASMCAHVDVASDLHQTHKLQALFNDFTIRTDKKTYRPEDLVIDLSTTRDTTWAKVYSGNLELNFAAQGGYESLLKQVEEIGNELSLHKSQLVIDEQRLRELLPVMRLHLLSGNDNPIANFLRYKGLDFHSLSCDLKSSPKDGLQGHGHIYSMVYDSVRIDTIGFRVSQDDERVNVSALVQNNKRNPQFVFRALLDGYLDGNKAGAAVKFFDAKDNLGVDASVKAEMLDSGICVTLAPYRQLLGYKAFNINENNFVFLARDNRVTAKVDLIADDGTGLKLYSPDEYDENMLQDLTVSLNKFDLGKLSDVIPYMPHVGGLLNGDFHVMLDKEEKLSVMSDLMVNDMTYEHSPMGNIGSEIAYLQGEGVSHVVEVMLSQNGREIGALSGTYFDEVKPRLEATIELKQTPLDLVNGFVPDQLLGLEGQAEGMLSVSGHLDRPVVNGEIYLNSSFLVSVPYGMRLRFDDDPVQISDSRLLFENFTVYAHNDNPLNIMGNVDFSNLDRIMVDLKMRARDYQIIGEKENNKSVAYGKAYVNIDGTIKGLIDNLVMKGKLDVLGKTDMGYILRDSPITTDNRLDELVRFRDFSDTTQVEIVRPPITGFTMDMSLNVSNGVHVMAYLNADHSNYIDLNGGGSLRMRYNVVDGLMLNGRYTLSNGKMKYSLPVIPLKTFTIQDGSYLEFHGDIMNPQLNITAEEETKATVTGTNGAGRSVKFVSGIVITRTLQDMGLEFTLDAPEDLTLHNELQSMSVEQRGKLAVTMLTTGMYLADGNTESFSMNNALSSFLNSEINQITGSALRTLDLSIGIDNSTNAQGSIHTDYSFQFAKRFWNNRLKISVGGKVSTGADVQSQQNNSFFDNVTFEYRLDDTANKYVTLFYNNNSYDWLDGYTQEYGAGFVLRKTLQNFRDLFKKDDEVIPIVHDENNQKADSTTNNRKEAKE